MGMTNRQFQGVLRLIIIIVQKAVKASPDNEDLKELEKVLQDMIEDGTT